jgi:hypothetical protein
LAKPGKNPTMKVISKALLIASCALCIASCASFTTKKPEEKKADPPKEKIEPPKLVGRIASIPQDKRFVLIQSYGKWELETGSILTTRGPDDRTANLLATGESLGEFAAADLQSGLVEVGDAVYSRHVPKPPTVLPSPETPQNQQKAPPENVQKNN